MDRKQSFITRNINSARGIELNRQIELNHISSITFNIKKDQQKQRKKTKKRDKRKMQSNSRERENRVQYQTYCTIT